VASEKRRVIIASGIAPSYVGGLGAYQRFLARALEEYFGVEGAFLAVKGEHPVLEKSDEPVPWPVETLAVRQSWTKAQRLLSSMASRPVLHPILERLVFWLIPSGSLGQIDRSANWMHFVGTGWDFFGFALLQAARRRKIPFTIWPAVHPAAWGDDAIDIRLYARADSVFCQSNHERRHLAALGVSERKLVWCGLPPMCRNDGSLERFRETHGISGDQLAVLFLGRRDEGKGYPVLLKAWPIVLQSCAEAVLLLAGPGGTEHEKLKEALPAGSLRDLGVPDEFGKADALAGCDVFCLPSAHEAFGIAYVEAWAYSKPVICGPAPACRELIENGVTGIWAEQDPADLAKQIVVLLQQSELRERIGREGYARQNRDFTPKNVAKIHLQALGDGSN
jgi:glycosyltransferase involved in cell wall biosynthesis